MMQGVLGAVGLVLIALASRAAMAADRCTEARITQLETSDLGTLVFLEVLSGDAPPTGNGGSNEPLYKPYLFLASSAENADLRKHLIASAHVALVQGTVVRFRWDDAGYGGAFITHLLIRST